MVKYQKEKITLYDKFALVRLNHIFLSLLTLLLAACQSREIQPKSVGVEYFPLKVGANWTYDVSETIITQLGGQSNSVYELKLQISDSVSTAGQITYIIQRFKRSDATQPWTAIETWSARKSDFEGVVQEGNVPFVKLAFPFVDGKGWNGNELNTLGGIERCDDGTFTCDIYNLADVTRKFEGASLSFDDTATVIENNVVDPIVNQDVRKSVYAKSVGLIYHEVTQLEYCTVGDCIGKQIVENGMIVRQSIKDYGGL